METVTLRAHVGADGMLHLTIPTHLVNADAQVTVVYAAQPQAADGDWASFVEETYGSLADDPIERPAQLLLETREPLE